MKRLNGRNHWFGSALLALALVTLTAPAGAATMVLAATKTPGGFDGDALKPNTQNVVVQVYEGLAKYAYKKNEKTGRMEIDPGKVLPHLAKKWSVSPDGLVYTIELREGVKSPFGNEMTSVDVVWGWQKSMAQKRTGAFIARAAGVVKVDVLDKYTVEFTLDAPNNVFLPALTLYTPSIYDSVEVKKHATADDPWALKWIDQNTAGFGAYHLQSLKSGEEAVFVATRIISAASPSMIAWSTRRYRTPAPVSP